MAKNSIEAVREAELKADEITRAATQESTVIVDEAHSKAVQLQNSAEDQAHAKAADDIAKAHKASQKAIEEAIEALSGEIEEMCSIARENQSEAVKLILASLVKQ